MGRTDRRSKKTGLRVLESIFFAAIFLFGVYILVRSPVFEVSMVKVEGNAALSSDAILKAAAVGIGENIFQLDLEASSRRISAFPEVKNVDMSRRLPSTVVIRVEERKPRALLRADRGFIQLDEEAVYIRDGDIAMNKLPVITGISIDVRSPGQRLSSAQLDTALLVAGSLPASLLPQLSEINIDGDKIVVYTLDGIQCRLGTPEDIDKKGEVFLKVLMELKDKERIEYIDLSYTGTPVVKYSKSAAR